MGDDDDGNPDEQPILVLRGLRVRMGLHSGVGAADQVAPNPATGRMSYHGLCLKIAHAISDSAPGGVVLMSGETLSTSCASCLCCLFPRLSCSD